MNRGRGGPTRADVAMLKQMHELQVIHLELAAQAAALGQLRQEQEAAGRRQGRLEQLFDTSPAGYLLLERSGRIVRANLAAVAMLGAGKRGAGLEGLDFERFVAPESQPALRQLLQAVYASGSGDLNARLFEGVPQPGAVSIVATHDPGHDLCWLALWPLEQDGSAAPHSMENIVHDAGRRPMAGHGPDLVRANRDLWQRLTEQQQVNAAMRAAHRQLRRLLASRGADDEEQRLRMARAMHDLLGQNLLALRLDLAQLRDRTAASHPRLHQRVCTVLDTLDATTRHARTIMNGLRPPVLDLGLAAAADWLVTRFRQQTGLSGRLQAQDVDLPAPLATALFRIIEQALGHVRQRGGASWVEVNLVAEPGRLELSVADNGPRPSGAAGAAALLDLAERAAAAGAEFSVAPQDSGFRICVRVPRAE